MRPAASVVVAVLLLAAPSQAHRLDEYLQATRITVEPDRIALQVRLTPGMSLADEVIALIDRDRDGRVAPAEARAYGASVLGDLVLRVDGRPLRLTLDQVRVPSLPEMRDGMASTIIEASTAVPFETSGRHVLRYRNDHQPVSSVYLANAMMPDSGAITIAGQGRDRQQRELRLDVKVGNNRLSMAWTAAAAALLGGLAIARRPATR